MMGDRSSEPPDSEEEREDDGRESPGTPSVEAGLNYLRERLGELQQSVELLGTQGVWNPASEEHGGAARRADHGDSQAWAKPAGEGWAPEQPADPYRQPAYECPSQPIDPGHAPAPPYPGEQTAADDPWRESYETDDPYTARFPQQPDATYGGGYEATPPPQAASWEQPYEQPLTYPVPPAATNGHTVDPAEISARSATVAIVDAGPFNDLIQLRHFEDELTMLPAVSDARVRRFGSGRANIEVGMTGPYLLARELPRLGRPMKVSDGPEGEVVIELAPEPEYEPAEEDPETASERPRRLGSGPDAPR